MIEEIRFFESVFCNEFLECMYVRKPQNVTLQPWNQGCKYPQGCNVAFLGQNNCYFEHFCLNEPFQGTKTKKKL